MTDSKNNNCPEGWDANEGSDFFTKVFRGEERYKCKYCGMENSGILFGSNSVMHFPGCRLHLLNSVEITAGDIVSVNAPWVDSGGMILARVVIVSRKLLNVEVELGDGWIASAWIDKEKIISELKNNGECGG